MSFARTLCEWFESGGARPKPARLRRSAAPINIEAMEERVLLYAVTGNSWQNPQVVTISFLPDGTNLGGVNSNLQQAFNNSPLAGRWQTEILRAAQSWGQYTNLNFELVSDSGVMSGGGAFQQGDPTMGDIRIGGYAFGNSTLARAYAPPPVNNFSIAGDITFNTGYQFSIGTGFDLFTIAAHEFGHALGLDHTSSDSHAIMWPSYNGVKSGLSADDVAGIQAIYSQGAGRSIDGYDAIQSNQFFDTASDVSSMISSSTQTAVISYMDISTTSDLDIYKFTVPSGSASTARIAVQSAGLSLFSPTMTVYAGDPQHTFISYVSGLGQNGTTLNTSISNVVPGQTYYICVQGSDSSAFGVGRYALILNMGSGPNPVALTPTVPILNDPSFHTGGGVADSTAVNDGLLPDVPTIMQVSPDTGASQSDRVTNATSISLYGAAPKKYMVNLYENGELVGTAVSKGDDNGKSGNKGWTIPVPGNLTDGTYTFTAVSINPQNVQSAASEPFTVIIDTHAPAVPKITGFGPDTGAQGDRVTNSNRPTVFGTAEAGAYVAVYQDGANVGTVVADSNGKWTYTSSSDVSDGSHAFRTTATDLAGNRSNQSASFTLTVDTVVGPPQITLATVTPPDDHGKQNMVVTGVAEAFGTVSIFLNGKLLGTKVADDKGHWSLKYESTTAVSGPVTASVIDIAGNQSALSPGVMPTIVK